MYFFINLLFIKIDLTFALIYVMKKCNFLVKELNIFNSVAIGIIRNNKQKA